MSREAFLIIIAAMIAGAVGFGIAVYAVPLEEIVQFRALIDAELGAISTTNHPDSGDTIVEHPTSPPSKASTELDSLGQDRSDASSGCDPRCLGGSPTKGTTPNKVPRRDEATQDSQPKESGVTPPPTNEPAREPSLSPNSVSEKARITPGAHLKPPVKKARAKNSPPSTSEN